MDLTEDMLRSLANCLLGKTLLDYQDKQIDFGASFARISVFDSILHYSADIKAEDCKRWPVHLCITIKASSK